MRLTRRELLSATAYGGLAAAVGPAYFPGRRTPARPVDPRGTTLASTVLRGPEVANRHGYRLLVSGPGEPYVVRAELGATAGAGREARRLPVLAFAQFTDMHLLDAQSPARVEFLDRYNDGPGSSLPFDAAYRPQEFLTTQLADALVRAVGLLGRGPVTGRPLELTICTGDNVDNTQLNEVRWFVDLLDGATVTPDSGDLTRYEGIADPDATSYDTHYWHPGGTPSGKVDDQARAAYGFPVVAGLLDAARRPFPAAGLDTPWYAVFGNHDPLLQGNAPAFERVGSTDVPTGFSSIATGGVKVVDLPAGLSPQDAQTGLVNRDPSVLSALASAPARQVTADARRRPLSKPEFMAEMFHTAAHPGPPGHGFAQDNIATGHGYYAFDHGPYVRCVVLDTMNPGGYADGSLDPVQFDWLKTELAASTAKLVVLFSHHTVATMTNPTPYPTDTGPRLMGAAVVTELLQWPNVILWVNGHTHANDVIAHTGSPGGFWEVNTAAHIDWPHQVRVLEIVDNRDGTLSVFATMVDADAPVVASYASLPSARSLAALGRELGANDWQWRSAAADVNNGGRRGTPEQRNVELLVRAPFPLDLGGSGGTAPTPRPRTGPPEIPRTGTGGTPAFVATALAVAAAGVAASRRRTEPEDT